MLAERRFDIAGELAFLMGEVGRIQVRMADLMQRVAEQPPAVNNVANVGGLTAEQVTAAIEAYDAGLGRKLKDRLRQVDQLGGPIKPLADDPAAQDAEAARWAEGTGTIPKFLPKRAPDIEKAHNCRVRRWDNPLPFGVHRAKDGKFSARVSQKDVQGRVTGRIQLGTFSTIAEAAARVAQHFASLAPAPQLPASDGAKGEAPASSPSLGVPPIDSPASSSEGPAFSGETLAAKPDPAPKPQTVTKVVREIEDDGARSDEVTRTAGAAVSKPLPKATAVPRPRAGDHLNLVPLTPFLAIDETALVVAGPKGEWHTHRPCISVLKRLATLKPDQLLDAATLANSTIGKMRILESVSLWKAELARIGVEFISLGENFRLRAAA
jgi:hypothetical protein